MLGCLSEILNLITMKSFTVLQNLGTNLSNNTSTDNAALMAQLENDQHRFLIQKYFDGEKTATTTTVGAMNLTTTASLALNAVSATLTTSWTYPTVSQIVNFSNGDSRSVLFTNGSTAITWTGGLTSTATTAIVTVGVQKYRIPANVSKIKDNTITIGQLKFVPIPVQTRQEWDLINTLPYSSDIPQYFFIYNGNLELFPIPSTTGNILTFNYQTRVADLSFADYSTGTLAAAGMVAGSTAVTGLATAWSSAGLYPTGVDITYLNLKIKANPPYGDGIWYPIRQFTSDTALILESPVVNAPNITAATTYTIGQFPLLQEDFHDMIVYGALKVYFSSIVDDSNKFKQFDALYQERLDLLESYAGTKQVNVDLGHSPQITNPNFFYYSPN
jgi:hypothetical protein